jgi:hypothetical protein
MDPDEGGQKSNRNTYKFETQENVPVVIINSCYFL